MSQRMNWTKARYWGRPTEAATPKGKPRGAWTHVKREPVRVYTAEERAAYEEKQHRKGDGQ